MLLGGHERYVKHWVCHTANLIENTAELAKMQRELDEMTMVRHLIIIIFSSYFMRPLFFGVRMTTGYRFRPFLIFVGKNTH